MMNEALTKNYEKIYKEKIAVIHAAYEDIPRTVAMVEVSKSATVNEKLELAFRLTNSIEYAWWENEEVTPMFPEQGCRSTSVGDMVLIGTEKYVCENMGWKKV
jgi:hypothetical protein|tara:strand:- start:158 stop:466 length:309 start_codon:yes stop_codon:yes gene_type:complete